jgi:hypothetical protein
MAKASRPGYILTLIGAVITLVFAFLLLMAGIALLVGEEQIEQLIMEQQAVQELGWTLAAVNWAVWIGFIVVLVVGLLKLYAASMMTVPRTTLNGGIFALILGVVVSDIFSLIGGIFGIVHGSQ